MATTTPKRTTSFRLPPFLVETLKQRAKECNSSLNSYVIALLEEVVCEQRPNPITMAAIEEAKSGKSAGIADTTSIDAFIKSCTK